MSFSHDHLLPMLSKRLITADFLGSEASWSWRSERYFKSDKSSEVFTFNYVKIMGSSDRRKILIIILSNQSETTLKVGVNLASEGSVGGQRRKNSVGFCLYLTKSSSFNKLDINVYGILHPALKFKEWFKDLNVWYTAGG